VGHIKKRKYVGTNDVVADVVKAIESDGRWDSVGAAKRLGAKNAAIEAAVDAYHAWIDSVESTAVNAVEEQVELRGAHTVQLPLDGMPEAFKAVTVVNSDGSKEILSLVQASPNQHKTMTSLRTEKKKQAYDQALARDKDSDRILAQVGPENADKPFGAIFPADVFPQVNTAAPLKEIGDGE
jgi:hypothetical protein